MAGTTKLEAANELLEAIGQTPVSSLSDPENINATIANQTLNSVKSEILQEEWHCNSLRNYTLNLDADNKLPLPLNAIQVYPSVIRRETDGNGRVRNTPDVTNRGGYLYDLINNTDVFSADLSVDIVLDLEWDDITPVLRTYIIKYAKKRFQMNYQTDIPTDRQASFELDKAEKEARSAEQRHQKRNAIVGNFTTYSAATRNFVPSWRSY